MKDKTGTSQFRGASKRYNKYTMKEGERSELRHKGGKQGTTIKESARISMWANGGVWVGVRHSMMAGRERGRVGLHLVHMCTMVCLGV